MSGPKLVPFEPPQPPHKPDGLLLSPKDPRKNARAWLVREQLEGRVWFIDGQFYVWESSAYRVLPLGELRSRLGEFLDTCLKYASATSIAIVAFAPTRDDINLTVDALQQLGYQRVASPAWLKPSPLDPMECVLCSNGILHIPTRALAPPTPSFFSVNPLDFAYDPHAPAPRAWIAFLDSLWPDDPEPIAQLQEWMGLCLTPETRYHKMLVLQGPPRCGKGTIARIIQQLVGLRNVCSPRLSNFGRQFGQAVLIDKTVAIFADAKISGRTDTSEIVESLLSISGEDTQTIPRKGLSDWIGTPRVRFTLLTNELPRMEDASGALLSRFLPLLLTESFVGREDLGLASKLTRDLPGILLWALDGWARLRARGRFLEIASNAALRDDIEELNSPITVFVRDCCDRDEPTLLTPRGDVFAGYQRWCKDQGREHAGTEATFSQRLYAAFPTTRWSTRPTIAREGGQIRVRVYRGIALKIGQ